MDNKFGVGKEKAGEREGDKEKGSETEGKREEKEPTDHWLWVDWKRKRLLQLLELKGISFYYIFVF